MTLTEIGQARIRGYMFVLERSLRTFLPPPVVADAVREVETHIFERLEQMPGGAEERATVERVLAELGAPLRVAQAYSMEMTVDEAIITGRIGAMARGLWHVAASTVVGFFVSLGLFAGYGIGASFVVIAALKPIFPNNVGLFFVNGAFRGFGADIGLAPGTEVRGGYWIIPVSLVVGTAMLLVTHALARRVLAAWKRRLAERRELRLLTPQAVTARSR